MRLFSGESHGNRVLIRLRTVSGNKEYQFQIIHWNMMVLWIRGRWISINLI